MAKTESDDQPARGKKQQFAALPLPALADDRLSGADLRVLAAIAYFDRLGKNGSGCYATQQTLAAKTGLHHTTVSTSQGKLRELGYILAGRQENRRRLQYKVNYESLPDGKQSTGGNSFSNGKQSGAENSLPEAIKAPENSFSGGYINRSCETEPNKSCVNRNKSSETAPTPCVDDEVNERFARMLRLTEQQLKTGKPRQQKEAAWLKWLQDTATWLGGVIDSDGDENIQGWAYRLLNSYDFPQEAPTDE